MDTVWQTQICICDGFDNKSNNNIEDDDFCKEDEEEEDDSNKETNDDGDDNDYLSNSDRSVGQTQQIGVWLKLLHSGCSYMAPCLIRLCASLIIIHCLIIIHYRIIVIIHYFIISP